MRQSKQIPRVSRAQKAAVRFQGVQDLMVAALARSGKISLRIGFQLCDSSRGQYVALRHAALLFSLVSTDHVWQLKKDLQDYIHSWQPASERSKRLRETLTEATGGNVRIISENPCLAEHSMLDKKVQSAVPSKISDNEPSALTYLPF